MSFDPACKGRLLSAKMLIEEDLQLVPRDKVHSVVEIDMAGVRNNEFWLRGELVGVLAENARVCFVTRNERSGRGEIQSRC